MAKRPHGEADKSEKDEEQRSRLVKVMLTDDEAKTIRVAAAMMDKAVGEFVREAAIERARSIWPGSPRQKQ